MASGFQIVPVLDVLEGRAVHAVGGDRSHYRPVRSILHVGHDPGELARAYREELGLSTIYLADLDAISGRSRNVSLYQNILDLGVDLWLDLGLRDAHDLQAVARHERLHVIAGLESLASPRALVAVLEEAGPDRLILSLDLRQGRPIVATPDAWGANDAAEIARRAIVLGLRRVILLDLARVGGGSGTGTWDLYKTIRDAHPGIEVSVGGGVARIADAAEARDRGAAAVLVGSALHDGRIGRLEIERLGA